MLHVEILTLVVDDLFAHFEAGPQSDGRKERRHLVILILRPALEGMVVALRAHHANAQEDLRGLLHGGLGIARHAVEIGRGIVVRNCRAPSSISRTKRS